MWEFTQVSGPRGRKNKTNKNDNFLIEKREWRKGICGHFFRNNFNLRGCAGVSATGGTRRAHHFTRVRDFTDGGFRLQRVGAQYSLLSPVTTSWPDLNPAGLANAYNTFPFKHLASTCWFAWQECDCATVRLRVPVRTQVNPDFKMSDFHLEQGLQTPHLEAV